MRKISEKEAKAVKGGYKCDACTFSSSNYQGYKNHMFYFHNVRV